MKFANSDNSRNSENILNLRSVLPQHYAVTLQEEF
jgi:hypothetical protein